jgi:hypothetical protein
MTIKDYIADAAIWKLPWFDGLNNNGQTASVNANPDGYQFNFNGDGYISDPAFVVPEAITTTIYFKTDDTSIGQYFIQISAWNIMISAGNSRIDMTVNTGGGPYRARFYALANNEKMIISIVVKADETSFYINGNQIGTYADVRSFPISMNQHLVSGATTVSNLMLGKVYYQATHLKYFDASEIAEMHRAITGGNYG